MFIIQADETSLLFTADSASELIDNENNALKKLDILSKKML